MSGIVYILRGIPGSGKSTLARKLALGNNCEIHSTDSYFVKDGKYCFDASKLGEYHNRNLEAFQRSLDERIEIVIVDNTNSRKWEFAKYEQAAEDANYSVCVVSLQHPSPEEAFSRNTHNVPIEAIRNMIARWEF